MNDKAIVEIMELLKMFESYTYYRYTHEIYIREMTEWQFILLYDIIQTYKLKFKIDNGIKIWLD